MPDLRETSSAPSLGLTRAEIDRTTYTYPDPRMSLEHVKLSMELSSAHADDDRIVRLETNPKLYPAQDAYIMEGKPQDCEFIVNMGNHIDACFGGMLDHMLDDPKQKATLHHMGKLLTSGETVVNAVPHGPLLDIGLLHAAAHAGLGRLGYKNRAGIIISQGVTGLASEFNGVDVPLSTALSWACHKIWLVTPRTENVRNSLFSRVVPEEYINHRNHVVRDDVAAEQSVTYDADGHRRVGTLITAALSGTTDRQSADGIYRLAPPTLGTLRMFARQNTRIVVNVGGVQDEANPSIKIQPELFQLRGDDQAIRALGDVIMGRTAEGLNDRDSDKVFAYDKGTV
jgi:hypothetical protein